MGDWIDLAVAILALVASIVAIWLSTRQHRTSIKEAREHKLNLVAVSEKLSSQYIGKFPDYLPELCKLVGSVKRELIMCSTIPIQGFFNAPDDWLELKYQLERLMRRDYPPSVDAIFSDHSSRRKYLEEQFRRALFEWDTWRKEQQNAEKLRRFAQGQQLSGEALQNLKSDEFLRLMENCADSGVRDIGRGTSEVSESPYRHFLNIWVVDKNKAMFSFPVTRPEFVNHAFVTEDKHLIDALVTTHRQYKQEARAVSNLDASS